ncbi:uncharacterized protein BHQ10_001257 [Talaromyces amestolkiae]|uniref:Uncharacterized protein n=1 Tax=Talaromyces amestolkiae TaxID=1196081 RepID=A0A364KNZ0_TALAM|nr:uncharacterized protein BHQ10_001257 [Talaromyces amestolkiae]RAO65245.1 hypothetical protein BHQ10_001257 [Talaromyces amestolkiae]
MKVFATLAAIVSVTTAQATLGYWKLYCGDSCSTGTLINQGNFITNVTTDCTSLGATYEYCYLEVPEEYQAIYHLSLSAGTACGLPTILGGGECTSAGSWDSYEMVYSA